MTAVVSCVCGFRGKLAELVDGACPRCGTEIESETKATTTTRSRSRSRRTS